MVIKNLKKASNRILKAIKNKERIILYGDADLDGTTSVIILKEAIKSLGGSVSAIYFPDRETEGHGITKQALDYLKEFSPALLITLDCGIGNFEEIKMAHKMGIRVIVVDHHKVLDRLPPAEIVVDPKQEGDEYPFKDLAAVGLAFKLSELLLKEKMLGVLKKNFLELAALGTVADMMPRVKENKLFIKEGLFDLENSWRPGIKAFFNIKAFENYNLDQKVSKMISILNVRDVKNRLPASFRLLTTSSLNAAKAMIPRLIRKANQRKERIRETVFLVEERIFGKEEKIVFEGGENWDFTTISPVASIICRDFSKPTFIFKKLKKESQGTVRVPLGMDGVALMGKCKRYVITYGGHPMAAGFRIKNENLEKFKSCLIKHL